MRLVLVLFVVVINLFAVGNYPSDIQVPKITIIKMDTKVCNDECLMDYYKRGMIFSFISNFNSVASTSQLKVEASEFRKDYYLTSSRPTLAKNNKIAVLIPKKAIGRYAESAVTSILAYLTTQDVEEYELEVFDSDDEEYNSIKNKIVEMETKGFSNVIAVVTNAGLEAISKTGSDMLFYIPTINRQSSTVSDPNFIYAGIDYGAQINKLLEQSNGKIAIFYDSSTVSNNITNQIQQKRPNEVMYSREIKNSQSDFKGVLDNRFVDDATMFLNTPLVKSSVLVSNLSYYNKEPRSILSTQINYKPLILDLTQDRDRAKMVLANSITKRNLELEEYNNMLVNDISYDWINYTSTVCIDTIMSSIGKSVSLYNFEIKNDAIEYDVKLYKPINYRLEELQPQPAQ